MHHVKILYKIWRNKAHKCTENIDNDNNKFIVSHDDRQFTENKYQQWLDINSTILHQIHV